MIGTVITEKVYRMLGIYIYIYIYLLAQYIYIADAVEACYVSKYTMYNYGHRRPLSVKDPCMADDRRHSRLKRPEFIPFLLHIYFAH